MKKLIVLMTALSLLAGCKTVMDTPKSIPMGSWNYKLYMNGAEMGSAVLTYEEKANLYISTMTMSIAAGPVQSTSKEVVTETKSFVPVKLEIYNQVISNGSTQNIDIVAVFNGKDIDVTAGGNTARITIDKPFVLGGNYLAKALLDKGFAKNSSATTDIYSPSLELEDTIKVEERVIGVDTVSINGKEESLIHIKQIMEDFQESDIHIDSKGVVRKMRTLMLNNLMELVIDK
jgi:hypothetical protein